MTTFHFGKPIRDGSSHPNLFCTQPKASTIDVFSFFVLATMECTDIGLIYLDPPEVSSYPLFSLWLLFPQPKSLTFFFWFATGFEGLSSQTVVSFVLFFTFPPPRFLPHPPLPKLSPRGLFWAGLAHGVVICTGIPFKKN